MYASHGSEGSVGTFTHIHVHVYTFKPPPALSTTKGTANLQLSFEDMSRRLSSHYNHITEIGSARRGIPKATNHSIHTLARGEHVG